jgi:membrane-associated protein
VVGVGVLASITDRILTLPAWLVLALVFAFPALEASAFVGFVFPGEIAVILSGVAASRGTVPLWAVIVAAVSGAIIGDCRFACAAFPSIGLCRRVAVEEGA